MIKAVIFDYGRTLVNAESGDFFSGVAELLDKLKSMNIRLALVSRSKDTGKRWSDFERLKIKRWFEISEVVPAENEKVFNQIIKKLNVRKNECLVVGDRIKSEIAVGNKAGMVTVWIQKGKFAEEIPQSLEEFPTYTISSIDQIIQIVDQLMK